LYSRIEIIRLKDGREFRGVTANQVGSRMIIQTAEGIHIVESSEVVATDIVEEQ